MADWIGEGARENQEKICDYLCNLWETKSSARLPVVAALGLPQIAQICTDTSI